MDDPGSLESGISSLKNFENLLLLMMLEFEVIILSRQLEPFTNQRATAISCLMCICLRLVFLLL